LKIRHCRSFVTYPYRSQKTTRFLQRGLAAELPSSDTNEFLGQSGGQIVHEMLARNGVKKVFGYPGGAILPVFDAIYESSHFDLILPRHEQGAGHMAQGYARASGKPGVVLVTSGPGATNVVTPMQDALSDGTPMIVLCGQVPTFAIGTDAFQEADIVGISRFCTKWNVMVKTIAELPRRINEAFHIATSGRPGPVLIDLPKNITAGILRQEIDPLPDLPSLRKKTSLSANNEVIRKVADMINNAKKPIIYAGQGIIQSGSESLLAQLANQGNIPVTTTLQALGAFDEYSPLSLHMLGMHGAAYANYAMQNADVIVALGARFDDRVTGDLAKFAPVAKMAAAAGTGGIIHFDILPKNINKVVESTVAVLGDCKENLSKLLPLIKGAERKSWFREVNTWKEKFPFTYEKAGPGEVLKPQQVLEELNRQSMEIKKDIIITTGVGQHQMWAAQFYRWTTPRSMITSGGLGTMGFGLPSAIGAKVAMPDKIVIDIDGDASFSMTGMELVTAAQYNIGVKVLILNNEFQGMVKQWQDLFYSGRYSATRMKNPDFVKMAEAMGCKGLRVTDVTNLESVIKEFLACPGPVVLDARVCKKEHVYPMVPAGKALNEMEFGSKHH
jgi:acetolactate synthase-1/2/3 large subunit